MPIMLRSSGKAKKIAKRILSIPANQQPRFRKRTRKVDKELRLDETKNVK